MMGTMTDIEIVRDFLVKNFLYGEGEKLMFNTSFIEGGIVDSTGIMELAAFIEERFGIKIDDEELVPENLDSLRNIDAYLSRKIAGKGTL
jgi:acyl carrier protein